MLAKQLLLLAASLCLYLFMQKKTENTTDHSAFGVVWLECVLSCPYRSG